MIDNRQKNILRFDEFEKNNWIQVSFYFVILKKGESSHYREIDWTQENDKLCSISHMSESDMEDTISKLLDCNYMQKKDFVFGISDGFEFAVVENNWLEFEQKIGGMYARFKNAVESK